MSFQSSSGSESVTVIRGGMRDEKNAKYKKLCHDLSIVEVLLGLASMVLASVSLVVIKWSRIWGDHVTHMAAGVWCGTMALISGILGILWKNRRSKALMNANLMMSIIAAVFMALQFIISLVACFTRDENNTLTTLHAFLALIAFCALVICILHSSYTCTIKCCFPWITQDSVLYQGTIGPYIRLNTGQTVILQDQPNQSQAGIVTLSDGRIIPKTFSPPAYTENA